MTNKAKTENVRIVLKRMRESAKLTVRQAGGFIGISHVAISQFENGKLSLPQYRIEQMITAYGFSTDDLTRITGRPPVVNPKEDCRAMIDQMSEPQLFALRAFIKEFLSPALNGAVKCEVIHV